MATTPAPSPRSGFSLGALRLPLAALGIFGLLAGLATWLVEGQFGLLQRILVAAGILLLGVVVALDPEDVWGSLTGRSAIYGGNALLIALAAIGILGLVNVLASRYQGKWDLTADRQFTLSDQSIRVAQGLDIPIKVTAFLTSDDSRKADFQALLNDYAQRSGGKLSYEFIDPDARPGEAIAMGVKTIGTVVYQSGDKKVDSQGTQERDITTALIKLTRPEKKLYFLTGHGERSLDGSSPQDYSQIKASLERDNFKAEPLNLVNQRAVPDDAAAVVIAGPTNPLLNEEKDALRAYLDGGGKLMILLSPQSKSDVNDLLAPWQVAFANTVVVDPGRPFFRDPLVPVIDRYTTQAITRDLRLATFYPAATSISRPAQPPAGATITALAETSDRSWGESNFASVQQGNPQPDGDDPRGPLALAVTIEQPVAAAAPSGGATSQRSTRVFLVGTADFVANNALSLNVPAGNQDLFLNAANWLAEQEDLTGIRAPAQENRQLLLQGAQRNLIFYSSTLFLPLAVLAAGLAVWWTRR